MKQQRRVVKSSSNPFSHFPIFSLRLLHKMKRERRLTRKSRPIKNNQPPKTSPNAIADCVFHVDIILCILQRLPVKSILRFKSVCKPWLELLSHPDFKKLHHRQLSIGQKNQSFIVQRSSDHSSTNLSLFQIGTNQKKPTILDHPFSRDKIMIHVVGCCNGLVCLSKSPFNDVIHLWNPALNMSKELFPPQECLVHERVSLGFGYDAEGDDFKVVRIVGVESQMHVVGMSVNRVEVYSVYSDSWVSIRSDIPFSVLRTVNDFYVNGTPYWVASYYGVPVLVYLDVKRLVLKFVPVMQLIRDEENSRQTYFDYNGRLGALLFTIDSERVIVSLIEVWVYDGDENYWTKDRTLSPIEVNVRHIYHWTKNGKIIGKRPDGKLFVCDPDTGRVEESFHFGRQGLQNFGVYDYIESLTYIDGMKQVKARKRTTKKMIVDAAGRS